MGSNTIDTFSKWPVERRYNYLILFIIFIFGSVIVYQNNELNNVRKEHNLIISDMRIRNASDQAILEAKLDVCQQSYLDYVKENKEEYQELLYQTRKLREDIQ